MHVILVFMQVNSFYVLLSIVELLGDRGIKSITAAFIQADVSSCQQLVGWFDQLDPQWNVIQCVQDKVKCMLPIASDSGSVPAL